MGACRKNCVCGGGTDRPRKTCSHKRTVWCIGEGPSGKIEQAAWCHGCGSSMAHLLPGYPKMAITGQEAGRVR